MDSNKRTALVTGANSGIGLATAKLLLSLGVEVIAHVRVNRNNLDRIASSSLTTLSADLCSDDQITRLIEDISTHKIDILVNNAGHYHYRNNFLALTKQEVGKIVDVNIVAPIRLTQSVLPGMITRSWGRIVNISSISVAHSGSASTVDYTFSKSALESITRSLAKEYAKDNVLINAVRVGVADTKFHQLNPEKNFQERIGKIPIKRAAKPEEIASVIAFLCSDQASYISGAIVPVSGGELG